MLSAALSLQYLMFNWLGGLVSRQTTEDYKNISQLKSQYETLKQQKSTRSEHCVLCLVLRC